jgi:hypothetical protein
MTNATESTTNYVERYFDSLLATYDILADAISKANERGMKISRQMTADVASGQREALELGKKIASEPANPAQFYGAILESAMNAQSRALAFTQVAYQEALEASTDARETIEKIVEANRQVSTAATEAARTWWTGNPLADLWRQQAEALTGTRPSN